jgi:hypothetical protein
MASATTDELARASPFWTWKMVGIAGGDQRSVLRPSALEQRQTERMRDCMMELRLVTDERRAADGTADADPLSFGRGLSRTASGLPGGLGSDCPLSPHSPVVVGGKSATFTAPWQSPGGAPFQSPSFGSEWLAVDLASLDSPVAAPWSGTGPPPPPPPPPGKGMPPPPPPPGVAKAAAGPKMRQLYWTTIVTHKLAQTAWRKGSGLGAVRIDMGLLREWFTVRADAADDKDGSSSSAAKARGYVNAGLLDPRRAQNVGILLAHTKMDGAEICRRVLSGAVDELKAETIASLLQMAPTQEEALKFGAYDGAATSLSDLETLFMQLLDVPRLSNKLQALLFTRSFEQFVVSLSTSADALSKGCEAVCTSTALLRVLEVVLVIGNALNKSQVRGFKLESLYKLKDTRATTNPKYNLVHFVARTLHATSQELCEPLEALLAPVAAAESVSQTWLMAEAAAVSGDFKLVIEEATRCSSAEETGLRAKLLQFAHDTQPRLEALQASIRSAEQAFGYTATQFGEDPSSGSLTPGTAVARVSSSIARPKSCHGLHAAPMLHVRWLDFV